MFYSRLGFRTFGIWGPGNVVTTIVQRGDVTILLQSSDAPAVNKGLSVFVFVDDPDALHEEYVSEGIERLGRLAPRQLPTYRFRKSSRITDQASVSLFKRFRFPIMFRDLPAIIEFRLELFRLTSHELRVDSLLVEDRENIIRKSGNF